MTQLSEEQKPLASAMAREIVETVNKTAISLAVCRRGLIREAEDDGTVMPDQAEDEIIQDVLECLTGEETGCLDPDELDAENCAVLMVQDRLNRAATAMRDKCVEALGQQRNRMLNLYQQIFTMKSTGDPQHPLQACIDYDAKVAFEEALESLTLDQVKPGEK